MKSDATHGANVNGPNESRGGRAPKSAGIDFVHTAPTFDSKLSHIMPQIASMGAAVAVADFDRDGWQDFYVTNSGENSLNRLYRNNQDGTFDSAAEGKTLGSASRNPAITTPRMRITFHR